MITLTDISGDEVKNGVALLDIHRPGWATERNDNGDYLIDTATLDIYSYFNCVLGQLYGGFGTGLTELEDRVNSDWLDAEYYGFLSRMKDYTSDWISFILDRRALPAE